MQLHTQSTVLLDQLNELILQMKDEEFTAAHPLLSGNSIGKHVRHILELFEEMIRGIESGCISYDDRRRSIGLESSVVAAVSKAHEMMLPLELLQDKTVGLKGNWSAEDTMPFIIQTSVFRELAYNIEHAIHHMAIIDIAVRSAYPHLRLPLNFGIAPATIRYKQQCAQ